MLRQFHQIGCKGMLLFEDSSITLSEWKVIWTEPHPKMLCFFLSELWTSGFLGTTVKRHVSCPKYGLQDGLQGA